MLTFDFVVEKGQLHLKNRLSCQSRLDMKFCSSTVVGLVNSPKDRLIVSREVNGSHATFGNPIEEKLSATKTSGSSSEIKTTTTRLVLTLEVEDC
jgi:hypothetical protein